MKFAKNDTPWLMKSAAIDVQIGTKIAAELRGGTVAPAHELLEERGCGYNGAPRHEAAEVAHEERRRDERRKSSDNRNLEHRVKRDDAALDPVEHHDVAEIPAKEQHAYQRNEIRDDEGDRRLGRKRKRHCRAAGVVRRRLSRLGL